MLDNLAHLERPLTQRIVIRRSEWRRLALPILMDALRLARVDLVGYGWGGLVACVLAARQPERVRSVVTLDTPLDCLVGGFRKRWDEARRDPEVLRRRLLREIPPGLSEEVRGRLERAIKRAPSRALRLAYADIPVREGSRAGANGELMLVGANIAQYPHAKGSLQHDTTRNRKLLVHRRQIARLEFHVRQKGKTLIPLAVYFKRGWAKCEIGLAVGKRQYDKREAIKERQQKRDQQPLRRRQQNWVDPAQRRDSEAADCDAEYEARHHHSTDT